MEAKSTTQYEYQRRINIVKEYIQSHLDEKIDLTMLADLSNLSLFHFHRITKAFLGEPIGAYISRIRVEKSANLLRNTDLPIQDIAYTIGYEAPSSLTKVFNQYYGISPQKYRNNPNFTIMKPAVINPELLLKSPKMVELEEQQIIYVRTVGEYSSIDFKSAYAKLWSCVKSQKLFTAGVKCLCIYYDDPKVTDANKLRTDVALTIHKPAKPEGDVEVRTMKGGKFAMFLYTGPYSNLGAVYDTIFGHWLPESKVQLRDEPCFEIYRNDPERTAPEKLKTEIYIPIK